MWRFTTKPRITKECILKYGQVCDYIVKLADIKSLRRVRVCMCARAWQVFEAHIRMPNEFQTA